MNVNARVIHELLSPLRQYFQKDIISREDVNARPPLRSELFSAEQMEQHGRQLAAHHSVSTRKMPEQLLGRLADNEETLFRVTQLLQQAVQEKKPITPAGEWLLDNFYMIEEEIQMGKRYLPKGYSKALPHLEIGRMSGFPRVYEIAIEIISHSDGRIDLDMLTGFISAYQETNILTIGELWAIPIMLRLALLENLSRVAARIAIDRIDSELAHYWAKQIIDVAESRPKDLVLTIADMARSNPPVVSAFVAEFARKLQWKGLDFSMALTWIEQHTTESGVSINGMILAENQKQAADQISVSNSIHSLRFLARMDWREFVEAMSAVDKVLHQDPFGTYAQMDFFTRDNYRHSVEELAKESGRSEKEIAEIAVRLAQSNVEKFPDDRPKGHVGFYLIDKGISLTRWVAKTPNSLRHFFLKRHSQVRYVGYIIASTALILIGSQLLVVLAKSFGVEDGWLVGIRILSFLCFSQPALAIVNWAATLWVMPKPLPRMNFLSGVPEYAKTLVIVPTLLGDENHINKLADDLEVRFLANHDPNILFGLATDFGDATMERLPSDQHQVDQMISRIEELNERYADLGSPFFLFHRPRRYNKSQNKWMGFERKRGKLADINQLLLSGNEAPFSQIIGHKEKLSHIKYVITLDTDTQLPREAAWKMIGLMAHPLNQPIFDTKKKRVVNGYGIIQPRIAISLHGAARTHYTRMNENDAGIDPYTLVTSEVYQDVFNEGSFIGKGIYEVETFEKVLNNQFPENRILSHDLLEGAYVRSAFSSDIQLYEDYPSTYDLDITRRYRWVRGDWQIANWCLPFIPSAAGGYQKNPLSMLSRWKIFDNLRRSLIPIGFTLFFLAGWTVLPYPWVWTLLLAAMIFLPTLFMAGWNLLRKPKEVTMTQHFANSLGDTRRSLLQVVFSLVCLPYEAFTNLDAITRTLWRINISKKNLLEWRASGFVRLRSEGLLHSYLKMWLTPVFVLATGASLIVQSSPALFIATPFLVIWFLSPAVVEWLRRPVLSQKSKLNGDQKLYLRELSRKTWSYFEILVAADDNWLPPDNLQQYPIPVIAHRTSPTNMGLSLLANLAAYDFGYITTAQLAFRSSQSLDAMSKLERHRGHFFNWYDTTNLKTLNPRYISTVDSGNLAAHLLTLRQGLLALPKNRILSNDLLKGLMDLLRLINKEAIINNQLLIQKLHDDIALQAEKSLSLFQLSSLIDEIKDRLGKRNPDGDQNHSWHTALDHQLDEIASELKLLAPWISLLPTLEKYPEWNSLINIPSLQEISVLDKTFTSIAKTFSEKHPEAIEWLPLLQEHLETAAKAARDRLMLLESLTATCFEFADMDYDFLYDATKRLLTIGYSVEEHRKDSGFYDLLASEARIASFVAIAQGKIPQENWFALGRRLIISGDTSVLLSWSGSMFEYLMPPLVMPSYEHTLLDETYRGTVKRQIEYGNQHNMPWGISESCYNVVDRNLTYQYRAFGIPGLGFKRGLAQDLVIAPYATVMALMVDPEASVRNLAELQKAGFEGQYGFFESVDYTPIRLSRGQNHALIQTFMVHHQGMSLLSLAYVLLDQPMQKRFESDQQFQTALLLLQEQVPKTVAHYSASTDRESTRRPEMTGEEVRFITTLDTPVPEVHLLSNGRYHVMVTHTGGGYSRWKGLAVTRWREDTTCDNWGSFGYIRDIDTDEFWSTTFQPTRKEVKNYEAIFSPGRAEFRIRHNRLETHTEIIVSPEDDVEVRRVHLTNHSDKTRHIEITSYAEVVLASHDADVAHPAFSNLFVQTEINKLQQAIICTRRPRSNSDHPPWMFHLVKVVGADRPLISYETNRYTFIGRGNTLAHPQVMDKSVPLSGASGSVLDPIVSIRYKITLEPQQKVIFDMVTGVAATKEENQNLIDKYQDRPMRDRAFGLSWTHNQVILRQIGSTESEAQLYGKLAGSVIYNQTGSRAGQNILVKNRRGQSALWAYSISGDLPIVLLRISDSENLTLVTQLIKAQAYWNMKGLHVDLVILNEDAGGYRQLLQDQIQALIAAGLGSSGSEKQGKIFLRAIEQVTEEDRILLQTVARAIISDTRGTLAEQLNKKTNSKLPVPLIQAVSYPVSKSVPPTPDLQLFNGYGGFSKDGKEYVILTGKNQATPMPWINVIANPSFGTVISESGPTYTWAENAHEFRLTPWNNDPVTNSSGEAFYVRDEESGSFWSLTPLPAPGDGTYIVRHGFGYSVFSFTQDNITTELTVHVDREASIKFSSIKIKNESGRSRKLSLTGFVEWVLGTDHSRTSMHIHTELESKTGAIIARNPYNNEFSERVAFMDIDETEYSFTTDRTEFIGRNGSLSQPDALLRKKLSGKLGAGLDPCAALQVSVILETGQEREITFRFGAGKDLATAVQTIKRFQGTGTAAQSLRDVKLFWQSVLGSIQIETPDVTLNILANGWLLYQVISCRLWGRTGFYQSGGAFGFRDQLQDVIALLQVDPAAARQHILKCASRQFADGDVQHWWHPPIGRGVRTLCSDDFLWLPYVTSRYVETTGDDTILKESVSFIQGRSLNVNEESYYDLPVTSDQKSTLFDHCQRSIQLAMKTGEHGLPLMGSGDWNDGMNLVGIHGKGESVWLAFFLCDVLRRFQNMASKMDDAASVKAYEIHLQSLQENVRQHAWDGQWYIRAFFDDGTPLGSHVNEECKIDAIAQSWSVLSGAGDPDRSQEAMENVDRFLVNRNKKLIQLLDPPFDTSAVDPGYIKGYVPGVRENGGQYTHGAIWMIMAFAKLGDRARTYELLNMINPLNHGKSGEMIRSYKVEPYVMAADVYGVSPHTGRGGWTWYTGSAGWMYQLITESFLGLKKEGNKLRIEPCVPEGWKTFKVRYTYLETVYQIEVTQTEEEEPGITMDNIPVSDQTIELIDDKKEHRVVVTLMISISAKVYEPIGRKIR